MAEPVGDGGKDAEWFRIALPLLQQKLKEFDLELLPNSQKQIMKQKILTLLLAVICFSTNAQESTSPPEQEKLGSTKTPIVTKGMWVSGATINYSERQADDYKFLVVDNINAQTYNVKTTAFAGYALADNTVIGLRLGYRRSMNDIGSLNLALGEGLEFGVKDNYTIEHSFSSAALLRTYIPLFNSNQIALFNDLQLQGEFGQGKATSGTGETQSGTYNERVTLNIGIAPGVALFINEFTAIETSVGILGFETSWNKQTTNQVYEGRYRSSSANFNIDLLSIKLGVTLYLNGKK